MKTAFRTALLRSLACCALAAAPFVITGCKSPPAEVAQELPDYSRPLGPGESALRKLGPGDKLPDLAAAWGQRDAMLDRSIDESLRWFAAPSSKQFFPFEDKTTHEQAAASLVAFKSILQKNTDEASFEREFLRLFDIYQTVGYNG